MKRYVMAGIAMLLPLAACGGSDDDATVATTEASDDAGATDTAPPAASDAPEADGSAENGNDTDDSADTGGAEAGSGPSTATVTLGDETYEFSTEGAVVAQCKTDLFGVFSVQLPAVDGDGSIQLLILHDDTDPAEIEEVNAINLKIGDERWEANEDSDLYDMSDAMQPGMSQVDSATIDGHTVSGTATFVREYSAYGDGEPETMTGTFEATCGEERIS